MNHVSLGVSKNNTGEGSFVANLYVASKQKKTKTVSVGAHGADIAFQTVDLWAEDIAKEFDAEYRRTTLKALTARLHSDNPKEFATKKPMDRKGKALDMLNNKTQFRVQIKKSYITYSATRIREVIKDGLAYLNSMEKEQQRIEKNLGKAKSDIARSMYTTFVDTGVDTSVYCNDETIVKEFKELQLGRKLI